MTITRLWQAGLESNGSSSHSSEFTAASGANTSSTKKKSGSYSLRCSYTDYASITIAATRQVRTGCHLLAGGTNYGSDTPALFAVMAGASELVSVRISADHASLLLKVGGVEQDTCSFTLPKVDFNHFGLDCKIHSSAGWAVLYIDGTEVMRFEGNTGNSDITVIAYGAVASGRLSFDNFYYDDLFIDDTTGEAAAAVVPDRRFEYLTPAGNGTYSQCTGSDGNSTDNYALVDDRPHNSDTDYVEADALDERDTYAMSNISLGAGYAVAAVIPVAYARKTDAGVGTQIALALYETTDWTGGVQALPTSYGLLWERRTTRPGGSNWDESSVNALEAGFVGKGTF